MINIEEVKKADPEEKLLCELIETDLMGVVVDECCGEDMLSEIVNAVHLYKRTCGGRIMVYSAGSHNNTPYIKMFCEGWAVTANFEFADENEYDKLLTRFLGSQALLTCDPDSNCARLAKEFYVPVICLSDRKDCIFIDGVFYISSEPSAICSALAIIKERKYTDELSGHKRLV